MDNRGIVILIEDFIDEWYDWAMEAELTSVGLHKIAVPGSSSINELLIQLDADCRKRIGKFEYAGIAVEFELHSLEWLLPRKHFDSQPDLFRYHNGRRTADMNCCVSNPAALDIISERAFELAKNLRQTSHKYYFWTDDAINSFCGCDKCLNLSGADQNMMMVNAMLRGVKAYDSKAEMSYLAYASALTVPEVKADNGVFLEFAPMDRNHGKPLNSPDEERGQNYIRILDNLLKIFPTDKTQVLEYWLDGALYSGYKYPPVKIPPFQNVMEADVKYYTSLGINTVKSFGSYISAEYLRLHGKPPVADYGEILKNTSNNDNLFAPVIL